MKKYFFELAPITYVVSRFKAATMSNNIQIEVGILFEGILSADLTDRTLSNIYNALLIFMNFSFYPDFVLNIYL